MCSVVIFSMIKKLFRREKMKKKIREQEKVIEMLSDQKIVKGLNSALDDVKEVNYIVLTN